MRRAALASLVLIFALAGCSENYGDPIQGPSAIPDDASTPLRPMSKLSYGVAQFPDREFSMDNMVPLQVYRKIGQKGIDFELDDLDGNTHRLADLLREKPVVLIIGSYTCTVYQSCIDELNAFAAEEFDLGGSYADWVHFVHVYVVEAHPQSPDPAPHYGTVFEDTFSEVPQARNYTRRQANAALLAPKLGPKQLLLLDDLRPHGLDNPIWSTYGSTAASAWFIGQDGVISAAHEWLDMKTLKKTVRLKLLGVG